MNSQLVVNNLLVCYAEEPGERGRAVVFLHGWRSSKEVWRRITEDLKVKMSRAAIFALDLPGFGGSQKPSGAWAVGDYAKHVAEFIKKMELGRAIVVGHSFGGRVGIKLAADFPQLVEKLVLVDSAGFAVNKSKKSLTSAAAKVVRPFFYPTFMQPLRKRLYRAIGAEDYLATPELQQTFVRIVGEDLTGDMKRINVPTLIVFGERDADTPPESGRRMNLEIQNSKFEILSQAGHFSFIDRPMEFVRLLSDFILK